MEELAMIPVVAAALALLLSQGAPAATVDASKVAASLERNRTAARKVSRSIDELKRRRDELRRQIRASGEQLEAATAGWESLDRETGVQEANLGETGRITAEMRSRTIRLAVSYGGIPPAVQGMLERAIGDSAAAMARLQEGWAGRVGQREAAGAERQRLAGEIADAEAELEEVEAQLRSQAQVRDRLVREAASLKKVFAGLPARTAAGKGLGKRIPWPIDGTAERASGELKGIVIRPRDSGQARAVAAGEVVFSNSLPGLGTVVILQHGEYFTVYGNLASSPLAAKAAVRPGDPLGAVEKALDAPQGGLYFEVRHHDRSLDPLEWLASLPGPGENP